jgi:hypothetical protein
MHRYKSHIDLSSDETNHGYESADTRGRERRLPVLRAVAPIEQVLQALGRLAVPHAGLGNAHMIDVRVEIGAAARGDRVGHCLIGGRRGTNKLTRLKNNRGGMIERMNVTHPFCNNRLAALDGVVGDRSAHLGMRVQKCLVKSGEDTEKLLGFENIGNQFRANASLEPVQSQAHTQSRTKNANLCSAYAAHLQLEHDRLVGVVRSENRAHWCVRRLRKRHVEEGGERRVGEAAVVAVDAIRVEETLQRLYGGLSVLAVDRQLR